MWTLAADFLQADLRRCRSGSPRSRTGPPGAGRGHLCFDTVGKPDFMFRGLAGLAVYYGVQYVVAGFAHGQLFVMGLQKGVNVSINFPVPMLPREVAKHTHMVVKIMHKPGCRMLVTVQPLVIFLHHAISRLSSPLPWRQSRPKIQSSSRQATPQSQQPAFDGRHHFPADGQYLSAAQGRPWRSVTSSAVLLTRRI